MAWNRQKIVQYFAKIFGANDPKQAAKQTGAQEAQRAANKATTGIIRRIFK